MQEGGKPGAFQGSNGVMQGRAGAQKERTRSQQGGNPGAQNK